MACDECAGRCRIGLIENGERETDRIYEHRIDMRDIIFKTSSLLLYLLMVFSACTDPMVPEPDGGSGEKMIPLLIRMKDVSDPEIPTYGTDYPGIDVPGSAWEDDIDSVRVYIFDNTFTCEKIVKSDASSAGPVMVKTGYKNIVTVVNYAGKLTLPDSEAATNYQSLLHLLTDASSDLPTSPFLMTGKKLNVNLPDELPDTAPYHVTIDVERTCAKIKVNVTKSGLALNHSIWIKQIVMYQGADQVALFEAPSPNLTTQYYLSDTTTSFIPSSGFVDAKGVGVCAMADSFYTHESLCGTDKSKAVKIEIEAYVNSTSNIRKTEFYLGEYSPPPYNDTVYDVRRNYWYVVNVDIVKPGMDSIDVKIVSCPWNVADPIDTIVGVGGEFKTALPFKLVKNLTYDDMLLTMSTAPYTSWAAINSHSKGASWIDFKVTNRATWEFNVKDNTARNQNVYYSLDSVSWTLFPTSGTGGASGQGIDDWQRIYIYRPYDEGNEPPLGPSLYATLNGIHKQDFIIQPRDTAPIPINCFVLRPQLTGAPINETRAYIPLAGVFSHWEDEIAFSDDIRSYTPIDYVVLWKDHPTQDVVKNVRVIHPNNPDSAYIYAEAGVPGNAVIAMKLATNPDKYWSFHIWVTEYNPYEAAGQNFYQTNGSVKNVFMDRNLGAMSNTWDAQGNARGLFYQYGRKDPFPRGENWDNAPPWKWYDALNTQLSLDTIPTSTITPSSDFRPKNALQIALNNPMSFITGTSGDDWPLLLDDSTLWISRKGNKTAYDPCPEGWRIPETAQPYTSGSFPWDGDLLGSGTNGFNNSIADGWYSPLVGYYPKSGYIDKSGDLVDSPNSINPSAYYWTSYTAPGNMNMAMGLFFSGASLPAGTTALDKGFGASVRCVVDKNYIKNAENGGLFGTGITNLKYVLLP